MSYHCVTIGEVARQIRGVTYAGHEAASEPRVGYLPLLRANNITDSGLSTEDVVYVPQERISPVQILRRGDILVATSSGSLSVVGKAARFESDEELSFGAFCKVVRPTDRVDPAYLAHYFQTPIYRQRVSSLAAGANINNLRNEHLNDLSLPLPPLPEQKRIAAILDKADAIRARRREAPAQADALLRATFLELFGDPVTNPKGWPLRSFGSLGILERGRSMHRPRNDPALLGGPYPLVQTGDVTRASDIIETYTSTYSELGLKQSRLWRAGTLCITIAANIAETAVLGFDACFPDSVVGFTPGDDVTSEYIQNSLQMMRDRLAEKAPAVAQANINLRILRDLVLPVPPKALQARFGKIVRTHRSLRQTGKATLKDAEILYASLAQRAFRGEL